MYLQEGVRFEGYMQTIPLFTDHTHTIDTEIEGLGVSEDEQYHRFELMEEKYSELGLKNMDPTSFI